MSHNISDFTAAMGAGNALLRPSQFEVTIPRMPKWASQSGFDGRMLRYYCNEASLPGVSIDTTDHRPYGMGFLEYFPTGVRFDQLRTTFYADANGELIRFFHTWVRNVVNFDPSHGPGQMFKIQYRDKYVADLTVTQFNEQGDSVLDFTYIEAFPVAVLPISVRWWSRDEVTEFAVIWKFKTYKEGGIEVNSRLDIFGSQPLPGTGEPGFATRAGGVVGRATSSPVVRFVSKKNRQIADAVNMATRQVTRVQNAVGQVQSVFGTARNIVGAAGNVPPLLKSKVPKLPKVF